MDLIVFATVVKYDFLLLRTRFMNHKVQTAIKATAVALVMVVATGCTNVENRIDERETKIGLLEQDVASAKSSAATAAAAQRAADSAQAAADAALVAANQSQSCCDATNEKMDRMFQRSQSK
jgi:hypothetical protein